MISIDRVVSPNDVASYISRNGGSGKHWHGFAKTQTAVGSKKNEIEASWLVAKGGSGRTLEALWGSYLATKGFTTGTLKERMKAFFKTGTQA